MCLRKSDIFKTVRRITTVYEISTPKLQIKDIFTEEGHAGPPPLISATEQN